MKRTIFIVCMLIFTGLMTFIRVADATSQYFDDFESYPDDATQWDGSFWEGETFFDTKIDDGSGVNGSKGIYHNKYGDYVEKILVNTTIYDVNCYGVRFKLKQSYYPRLYLYFYDESDNQIWKIYISYSDPKDLFFCDTKIFSGIPADEWLTITVEQNPEIEAWHIKVIWDGGKKETNTTACAYVSDLTISRMIIKGTGQGSQYSKFWFDDFQLLVASVTGIPEYEGYLKVGGVDTSMFYSTSYKYAEYKRWVYKSGVIIKRLDVAFDENENLSSVDDVECVLCGINIGKPNSITKYIGTYNYIWLAEWDGLDIELNGYLTIELKRNGQNFKGLGVWAKDIDGDGQQNLAFHNNNDDYGNGIAPEGIRNILYDLAYRIYYVYEEMSYEDTLLLNIRTVYVYDTLAIKYTCAEDGTRLIILKPDDSEAVNVSISSKGTYYYTPTSDIGAYEVHLYRDGSYVCNDTFTVLSSGDWGVWVDKNDVNVGETITIYYNTSAPAIVDTGVNEYYVNGSGRICEQYYNRGQYVIKLYKLVNGTMYLMDSEVVVVGSTYFTDMLHAYPDKPIYGHEVYLHGTTEHLLYSPYLVVYPENKVIPVDSMEFNITFYPQKLGDHYVIMKVGNKTAAETSFIVVSEGAVRYELKYLVSLIFIIVCAVLGITITSHFNLSKDIRAYVIIVFIFIGISTTALMNLLPLWVPFMLGLITVVWIIWRVVK